MKSKSNNEVFKIIIALFIGLLISIILCEAIVQMLDIPPRIISGWLNCKQKNPGECNQLGFRGQRIKYSPDDFVVLLLGDSEVYAPGLQFKDIPERRLQHHLNIIRSNAKVFSIADMGYGQDQQYLALLRYYEKYKADLVVLFFTSRNDIENNMFPSSGRNRTPKPTFWIDKGLLKGPSEGWLQEIGYSLKLSALIQNALGLTIGTKREEFWNKKILPQPYQPLSKYEGEVDYSWQEQWKKNPEEAFKGIEQEKVTPAIMFTPRSARMKYGIDLTRRLILQIKSLVEKHNGHFIIFKEERPWEIEDNPLEKVYFLKKGYYKTSLEQYKRNLNELFDGFELYRLPVTVEDYTVSKEDMHLSAEAIDQLMKDLAEIISQKYLL